jgi:BolA protein
MDTQQRLAEIRHRLEHALQPRMLDLIDEGHLHVGHEGAKDGRGHFRLRVVSGCFVGQTLVQRHRLIYQLLGDLMQSDIHALAIEARAPDEIKP